MRRKEKLVTDKQIIERVIYDAHVCRVALVDEGRPYIVPMNFGYDGRHIYLHSAASGQKVDILAKNNRVCLEFEQGVEIVKRHEPCSWGANYLTVIVHGQAEVVSDATQKNDALTEIVAHYDQTFKSNYPDYIFPDKQMQSVLVYRITPSEMVGKISGYKA